MTWPTSTIADVAEVNPRPTAGFKPESGALVSFVPMAAVSALSVSIEDPVDRPYEEVAKGFTAFQRGDILVAKITPCFENGKMAYAKSLPRSLGFGSTEFHVLRPGKELDGSYLFHLLREPFVRLAGEMKMKGAAGQRRVPAKFFAEIQIPLPPLAEQKRIAGVLDAADALRAKRRESLAQLDTLLQSTFPDMFGDPVTNPMGWEQRPLVALCERTDDIRCGPFGTQLNKDEFRKAGVPLWGIKHVNAQFHLETDEFVEAATAERLAKYDLRPGDLVMTRKGTIGNCAVYPEAFEPGIMHSDVLRLRLDQNEADPSFLAYQLHYSSDVHRQLSMISGGAVMPGINVGKLKKLNVEVPPLDLQHRFASIVESVEQQKASQRAHLDELDTLFASLQSRAFQGEL